MFILVTYLHTHSTSISTVTIVFQSFEMKSMIRCENLHFCSVNPWLLLYQNIRFHVLHPELFPKLFNLLEKDSTNNTKTTRFCARGKTCSCQNDYLTSQMAIYICWQHAPLRRIYICVLGILSLDAMHNRESSYDEIHLLSCMILCMTVRELHQMTQ